MTILIGRILCRPVLQRPILFALLEGGCEEVLQGKETNTPQTDPHLLRRLPGDVDLHWLVMASELVGLLGVISRLKKIYQRFSRPAF